MVLMATIPELLCRWGVRQGCPLTNVPGGFSMCPDDLCILGVLFWREDSAVKNWEATLKSLQAKAARDLSLT